VATSVLGRRGADLFRRVAARLTSGDAASLSAAHLYRKALHLLPDDDGSTRTALEAALNAVEERTARHGITCDQVLPRSNEELKELPERHDLIITHGDPGRRGHRANSRS
jgi:hypothetical protein